MELSRKPESIFFAISTSWFLLSSCWTHQRMRADGEFSGAEAPSREEGKVCSRDRNSIWEARSWSRCRGTRRGSWELSRQELQHVGLMPEAEDRGCPIYKLCRQVACAQHCIQHLPPFTHKREQQSCLNCGSAFSSGSSYPILGGIFQN